jgi:Iap family predicted aminopeptidase
MRRLELSLPAVLAVTAMCGCAVGGDDNEQHAAASSPGATSSKHSPAVTSAELMQHLRALQHIANRNHGTRAAGTAGYAASADYVAARLEDAGWTVTRQPVPFANFRLHRASLFVGGRRLTRARDFQVMSYSGSGHATGRLRDVGLGCAQSDFKGLRRGEIPLAERGQCFNHDRATNAERAGARAIVVWSTASKRGVPSGTLGTPGIPIPVVVASNRALGPHPAGTTASVTVRGTWTRRRTENVIAETPGGSGDRVVMAGGHLDSVPGGPGIDDNGTGVATLLESAEAIGPNPPGAKVRLVFWGAEELGLLGSRYYVTSLDKAGLDGIAAYLNFDMVGSPNAVPAVYADGNARLARVLRRASGRRLKAETVGQSSDHTYFQIRGVPVNGLYTGASEPGPGGRPRDPCYHLACDTTRNVNRPVLLRMGRTAARALERLSRQAK